MGWEMIGIIIQFGQADITELKYPPSLLSRVPGGNNFNGSSEIQCLQESVLLVQFFFIISRRGVKVMGEMATQEIPRGLFFTLSLVVMSLIRTTSSSLPSDRRSQNRMKSA